MLDIGLVHRKEYEIDDDRSRPDNAGEPAEKKSGRAAVPRPPEDPCAVVIAEAPGRMHFLGEHGEPGAGLYLSSAIDRTVRVAVSLRKDNSIRFYAADLGERKRTTLINLKYKREDRWANFIKVAIHVFAGLGCPVKGLNFTLSGTVPQQVGLASSSAIEAAAAVALRGFFQANINDRDLVGALASSRELFFGKSSPVDYLAVFSARKDQFLVIDEATLEVKKIKSPLSKYRILVMDSRVPRMGVEEELKQRRDDIKKGLDLLSRGREGASFRDFAAGDLVDSMGNLPEEIRRRSMHVVEEIQRIADAETALREPDLPALSRIITHSHESLRDLYEVSCPEVDWLVKRAQEIDGVLGSRMTGQGFGGCTYTILRENAVEEYKKRLEDYERIFGFHPVIYEVRPATGVRIVHG